MPPVDAARRASPFVALQHRNLPNAIGLDARRPGPGRRRSERDQPAGAGRGLALRVRVAAYPLVFFMGAPQLGELEAGLVADWVGAPMSVVSGGVGCLTATAWIALRTPALRRYRR